MSTANEDLSAFPQTEDQDPDDVSWALETGKAMWAKGDHQEALRWLRKAAEAASEEGADLRALALAKAAADRRSALELPQSLRPSAVVDEPTSEAPPRPPESAASAPPAAAKKAPPPPKRKKPTATSDSPPPAAAEPVIVLSADDADTADEAPGSVQPEEPTKEWKAEELLDAAGITAATIEQPLQVRHQAVLVAYGPPGDDGVFRARPVKPGERPPGGTQLALLVALDASSELFPSTE